MKSVYRHGSADCESGTSSATDRIPMINTVSYTASGAAGDGRLLPVV